MQDNQRHRTKQRQSFSGLICLSLSLFSLLSQTAFVEAEVPQGASEVSLQFPRGSDAITEYDIYVFVTTPIRK
jgi:hypothetical protein